MDNKYVYIGIAVFSVIILFNDIVNSGRMRNEYKKLRALELEHIGLMHRVEVLDAELRIKDSFLLEAIGNSYAKIEEMSKIRKMSLKEIDSLEKKIHDEKLDFETVKTDLLSW